ncbi:MAG: branched-chain amino acid ABC transporter permease [Desulfobacteraceae bacterium]|nr:branched-chain amino acid ABC transporter permease [Desulfobacteraceae bacterium]
MGQLFANILFSSCNIFLVAISFSLIFSTARFFHFAHAAVITIAAYVSFALSSYLGLPIFFSVLLGLVATALIGWGLELVIYRPMRRREASPLVLLLTSLGLYILLQNVISLFFGDDTKIIASSAITPAFSIIGVKLTGIQLTVIFTSFAVFFAKTFLIDKTRLGLTLKAIADDPELAKVSGIDYDSAMGVAFGMGSLLAGATGLFRAFDVGMTPTMGLPMLLLGVVAVVVGGNGKTLGIAVASFLLAFCQQIAGWKFGTQWEETIAFILLLTFLLYRPHGIMGKQLRKATV